MKARFFLGLALLAVGCASPPPPAAPPRSTLAYQPASYTSPRVGIPAPSSHSYSAPAASTSGYVRLRGSSEIHLPSCSRVARACSGGAVPAGRSDGPACPYCRGGSTAPAPRPAASAPAPAARRPAPAWVAPTRAPAAVYSSAGGYVRLRGSAEIHVRGCPRVKRADPAGVLSAGAGDGPPCFTCRHAEATARR